MNKSTSIVLSVIAVVIIIGGWVLFSTPRATAPVSPAVETSQTSPVSSSAPTSAVIEMTKNGFTPDPVTIKVGGTVTFKSIDGTPMWVASNAHPSHAQYDGTTRAEHCASPTGSAFDQCVKGSTYSFKFLKVGQWNYHNHLNADDGGTIIVE